jgi:hypothetical protein
MESYLNLTSRNAGSVIALRLLRFVDVLPSEAICPVRLYVDAPASEAWG